MSEIDAIDAGIIAELRNDGRATNSEIARRIGTTEAMVRRRIDRLISRNILRIVAVTNPYRQGFSLDALVNAQVDVDKLPEVAARVAEIPEVRYASIVSGDYNLTFRVLLRSHGDFYDFVTEKLGSIPGLQKVETAYVLRVVKRTFDWVPEEVAGLSQLEISLDGQLPKHSDPQP
ncbi:MAG: Lrp/AsnC family transcriptional regulator [Chloroflexota bacterium]